MKKGIISVLVLICMGFMFVGCQKDTTLTIDPYMTASIGTYSFNAEYIQPAFLKSQINDTGTTLIITGYDRATHDTMIISVTKYNGQPGTFSIAQGQANASYRRNGTRYDATGGIVAIKEVGAGTITGYYNFSTPVSTVAISNGTYVCGNPWNY